MDTLVAQVIPKIMLLTARDSKKIEIEKDRFKSGKSRRKIFKNLILKGTLRMAMTHRFFLSLIKENLRT